MSKKSDFASMRKPPKLVRQVNRLEYDVSWLLDKETYERIMKRKQSLCASKLSQDTTNISKRVCS